jgi:purine/pyrimidine-nucleoside phosphorylase
MPTDRIDGVAVTTRANVYFDGRCISHGITFADGTRKSVGVVLPSTLTFNVGAPEVMEGVAGACEYRLRGDTAWTRSTAGQSFAIGADSSFEIRVSESDGAYHYVCHFG